MTIVQQHDGKLEVPFDGKTVVVDVTEPQAAIVQLVKMIVLLDNRLKKLGA